MNSDNLIFNSNIDNDVENVCFDILLDYYKNQEDVKIYVENVILAPNEILFLIKINDEQSILRIRVEND